MLIKYRVSEVAKDFGKTSKEVTGILSKYFDKPKKSMTALEENELDIVFEYFTQNNQVESFDDYFSMAEEKKPEDKEKAKSEVKTEVKPKEVSETAKPSKTMPRENRASKGTGSPQGSQEASRAAYGGYKDAAKPYREQI